MRWGRIRSRPGCSFRRRQQRPGDAGPPGRHGMHCTPPHPRRTSRSWPDCRLKTATHVSGASVTHVSGCRGQNSLGPGRGRTRSPIAEAGIRRRKRALRIVNAGRCPVLVHRSRTTGLRKGRASLCKYGKCVRREKQECANSCKLEQGSCWILAGRELAGIRGSPQDAPAPLGPSGGVPPRRMRCDGLPDVRARRTPALQGPECDPRAGGDVESLFGEGPTMSVEIASQLAQPSGSRARWTSKR